MEKNGDYFVALYENFEVRKLSEPGDIPESKVKFLVHCRFRVNSSSKKNSFYNNFVFDHNNEKTEGNHLDWDGVKCRLEIEEKWKVVIPPSHNGVSLSAVVFDKLGTEKTVNFDNSSHNGYAFKKLVDYIKLLIELGTHCGVEAIKKKEVEITKLKNQIEEMGKLS